MSDSENIADVNKGQDTNLAEDDKGRTDYNNTDVTDITGSNTDRTGSSGPYIDRVPPSGSPAKNTSNIDQTGTSNPDVAGKSAPRSPGASE